MGKINKEDMNELFDAFTSPVSTPAETTEEAPATEKKVISKPSKKISLKDKEKFCANISTEKMDKIRAMSRNEGLTLTDTVEACLELAIKTYEEKNGVIKTKAAKKGDASKIFG